MTLQQTMQNPHDTAGMVSTTRHLKDDLGQTVAVVQDINIKGNKIECDRLVIFINKISMKSPYFTLVDTLWILNSEIIKEYKVKIDLIGEGKYIGTDIVVYKTATLSIIGEE